MTHSVGIRTYQLFITKKRKASFVALDDEALSKPFPEFLSEFVTSRTSTQNLIDIEKSWKFNPESTSTLSGHEGTIAYGRYGFAASLIDIATGNENYRRKRTDSEVLNLFYRFWLPEGEKFCVAAFESFSGRSCITLVFEELRKRFEGENPELVLRIRKLMPTGASAKIYAGKPIKNIALTTRKPPNDLADKLFKGKAHTTKRMTVKIFAGRNDLLGDFTDLINSLPADGSGVLSYDGVDFDKAVADVKVGKEIKPVGVFGAHDEVGVIDITEDVSKDADGLPTFQSVKKEADKILAAVYETLQDMTREN
ncbi:hypothetical protein [Erythrobacter rubeus]|uniref:Uncharacterized protein n=1 Tax=Erythrobacter rubeus TaxID=2760803 RepID=A0ABR8KQS9_9SPHN|nr:hypothetical protein [Erythrobacter rubeus]MBD2841413.1 hypothetical protein [Erythrobacter rubeus]